jgi:hypothetical protein
MAQRLTFIVVAIMSILLLVFTASRTCRLRGGRGMGTGQAWG